MFTLPFMNPPSRGTRGPRVSHSYSHLRLRLKHERLSQRFLQNRPTVVHGVQKPEQFATQLPILGRHRTAQQPEGVVVTRVELLEAVQDEEVRARRSQSLRAQACLRRIGENKNNFFSIFIWSVANAERAGPERSDVLRTTFWGRLRCRTDAASAPFPSCAHIPRPHRGRHRNGLKIQ